jgi:molybdopterin molybdotransferase
MTRDVRMCGFAERRSVAEALGLLEPRIARLGGEPVAIELAGGRVAAADVVAEIAVPHFARAMMDGYALVAEDTFGASDDRPARLAIVGELRAGDDADGIRVARGQACRITTGAMVPAGANAVAMAEICLVDGDEVLVQAAVSPNKHVGAIGEDVAVGEAVLGAGRRLRPQDVGVVASVGVATLDVVRRPRVRIVVTGNELIPPGDKPRGPQVVDANSLVLRGLIRRDGGIASVTRLPDDPAAIAEAMLTREVEVVLVSGGSSVGPEDHAPRILAEGGELVVHGVAMRPSSPAGFGFFDRTAVFLLPGNPVSCLCAYEFFAGPAIRKLGGLSFSWPHRRITLRAASKLVSQLGRTDFMRVRVEGNRVVPIMTSGASILSSTTRADGVVIIPDEVEGYPEDAAIEVFLWDPS